MIEIRGRRPVAAANARARSASARGIVVAVVDAGEQRHRPHRRQAGRARVLGGGREHVVERCARSAIGISGLRRAAIALRDREPEAHLRRLAREPADARRAAPPCTP